MLSVCTTARLCLRNNSSCVKIKIIKIKIKKYPGICSLNNASVSNSAILRLLETTSCVSTPATSYYEYAEHCHDIQETYE